jgi:hypothetical protein
MAQSRWIKTPEQLAKKVANRLLYIDIELYCKEPLKSWLETLVHEARVVTGKIKEKKD